MLVIPAIDILNGRCVRLHQGSYDAETVYFEDPVEMGRLWRVLNSKVLHVVDLNAARGDSSINRTAIKSLCEKLDIPVQVGGGVRTMKDVDELLGAGVYRVIIGTAAVRNPELVSQVIEKYGNCRLAVGIDAKDGEVRVQGWTEGSGINALDLAIDMEARGCRRVVYTDISRDGTMQGPNTQAYQELGAVLRRMRITASGGVSSFQDLVSLDALRTSKVDSAIVGRALYDNAFPCQKFWCWHDKGSVDLTAFSTARLRVS
ncbi:MAG: 1-(5-phosphoribosyl)-5-[(5-phosphoribosylamino)methylideneamino]imidazole-4-carboxamide isomerase [Bacteroidota bacterium]